MLIFLITILFISPIILTIFFGFKSIIKFLIISMAFMFMLLFAFSTFNMNAQLYNYLSIFAIVLIFLFCIFLFIWEIKSKKLDFLMITKKNLYDNYKFLIMLYIIFICSFLVRLPFDKKFSDTLFFIKVGNSFLNNNIYSSIVAYKIPTFYYFSGAFQGGQLMHTLFSEVMHMLFYSIMISYIFKKFINNITWVNFLAVIFVAIGISPIAMLTANSSMNFSLPTIMVFAFISLFLTNKKYILFVPFAFLNFSATAALLIPIFLFFAIFQNRSLLKDSLMKIPLFLANLSIMIFVLLTENYEFSYITLLFLIFSFLILTANIFIKNNSTVVWFSIKNKIINFVLFVMCIVFLIIILVIGLKLYPTKHIKLIGWKTNLQFVGSGTILLLLFGSYFIQKEVFNFILKFIFSFLFTLTAIFIYDLFPSSNLYISTRLFRGVSESFVSIFIILALIYISNIWKKPFYIIAFSIVEIISFTLPLIRIDGYVSKWNSDSNSFVWLNNDQVKIIEKIIPFGSVVYSDIPVEYLMNYKTIIQETPRWLYGPNRGIAFSDFNSISASAKKNDIRQFNKVTDLNNFILGKDNSKNFESKNRQKIQYLVFNSKEFKEYSKKHLSSLANKIYENNSILIYKVK